MVSEQIHQRFLRDPWQIRLGNLASDLARAVSWSEGPADHKVVASILEEAKYFCEWAALNAPSETQAVLAKIQSTLSAWEHARLNDALDEGMRAEVRRRSDELLTLAGLVTL